MSILCVTYTITPGKRDYASLYEAIKAHPATTWWHYLDSTWLVKTTESPTAMSQRLVPLIDSVDDSLLIVEIVPGRRAGWLPKKAWDWIKTNSS